MKWIGQIAAIALVVGLSSASCEDGQPKQQKQYTSEDLLEMNKARVGNESEKIEKFIAYYDLEMQQTATGLQYNVYAETENTKPNPGDVATISYKGFLLDSTLVASTDVSGLHTFRIGEDPLISGLHEAVQLLHVGDSARFIVPSYLAYGLTGDGGTVPPNATLFYDLCLVDLR